MTSFAQEVLRVDRQRLDVRAGVLGLAVLTVFGLAVALVGPVAVAGAIGALVVLSTDPAPAGRSVATALLPLVAAGTVLTFVAVGIGDHAPPAALLAGAVGVAATVQGARSRRAEIRGLVTTLWIILALTLHDTGVAAWTYAAAFGIGAAAGTGVAWARSRAPDGAHSAHTDSGAGSAGTGADDVEAGQVPSPPGARGALIAGPIGRVALLRGGGLAVAVLLGFTLFPAHPAWVAITAVIVMRAPTRTALVVGLQRSLGTGIGVIVAVALAGVIGENRPGLVILFLATAFLMMALREVNYALFAMLVTALVVYAQRILGGDAAESGRDRLAETILGVIIAFVVLGVTEAVSRGRRSAA